MNAFVSKVRPVGSSLGIIIPKEIVESEELEAGREVNVSLFKQDFRRLDKLFGSVKETTPFERDRKERV